MLKEVRGAIITHECNICKTIQQVNVTGIVSNFNIDFGEYDNLQIGCTVCNSIEIFNMNIEPDAEKEGFKTGDLPIHEEVQRNYVRVLMRIVRKDFIDAKKPV